MTDLEKAARQALKGAANYIDTLGGDSRKYRQVLANEALDRMADNARELGLDYDVKSDHRLMEQPEQQEIDWKDQYKKQKRRADMWIAKYEADIGSLEKAGPVTAQRKPLTDEEIVAGARVLNQRMAEQCGVDADDQWALYADDFKAEARAVLEAAARRNAETRMFTHSGIKGNT